MRPFLYMHSLTFFFSFTFPHSFISWSGKACQVFGLIRCAHPPAASSRRTPYRHSPICLLKQSKAIWPGKYEAWLFLPLFLQPASPCSRVIEQLRMIDSLPRRVWDRKDERGRKRAGELDRFFTVASRRGKKKLWWLKTEAWLSLGMVFRTSVLIFTKRLAAYMTLMSALKDRNGRR